MTENVSYYELQIDHPALINDIPVERYAAMLDEWKDLSFWQRMFPPESLQPLRRKGRHITVDVERLRGMYTTFDQALAAAERIAQEKVGELHEWANVLVVAVTGSEREVVDGLYPGDGGPI
jgi:hypothetical protein